MVLGSECDSGDKWRYPHGLGLSQNYSGNSLGE